MDKRDLAIQKTIPIQGVPFFGQYEGSNRVGDRVLMAGNGIFLEVTRKWGVFIRKISSEPTIKLPYGTMQEQSHLNLPELPNALLKEFNRHAATNCDVEVGASVIWNEHHNKYRLAHSKSLRATGSFLHQELPALEPGDHLIIDCHSHAHHPAYFSPIDNESDANCIKFSYVVGNCNLAHQTHAFRLCVRGVFESLDASALGLI